MSAIFKCNDGNEHDFDSNTESEYCAKGCGEKWAIYAIKKLGADLKEKDAAVEQLKAENEKLKSLFSVQLDVMEQNNNMTTEIQRLKEYNDNCISRTLHDARVNQLDDEITALKSRLLDFEGRTYSENQEIAALKSKLKIAVEALVLLESFGYITQFKYIKQALSEIGGEI